ncbi:MAG: helix-turn-helix domain-containing protein, partial [Paracoccaceae bacterium]
EPRPWIDSIHRIARAEQQLGLNANVQLCVETLVYDLARMARQIHKLVQSSYIVPPQFSDLGISTQQLRVLSSLQNGASNKQVARSLGLSEAAIKYHVTNLFRIFGVTKRGELIETTMK